jgi:hypothetical protein
MSLLPRTLGSTQSICQVVINWETAYAKAYAVVAVGW